jgi:hypothetical protein
MSKIKYKIIAAGLVVTLGVLLGITASKPREDGSEVEVKLINGRAVIASQGGRNCLSQYDYAVRIETSFFQAKPRICIYDSVRGSVIRSERVGNVGHLLRFIPKKSSVIYVYGSACGESSDEGSELLNQFAASAEAIGYAFDKSEYVICVCPDHK